ncbi:MAG: hypothetical protein WCJ35_09180 [Planctomycetota bacterium]
MHPRDFRSGDIARLGRRVVLLGRGRRSAGSGKGQVLVLCGRAYGGGEIQMAGNLRVVTVPAECG